MTISVLLATYNGEKFLREQLESLLQQTYQDFTVYISDDNSSDSTMLIINEYKKKYTSKFQILEHHSVFRSAKVNFLFLLKNVQSDLYLFCDQDDVWTNNHVEILVNRYVDLSEKEKKLPILLHTDLTVVDEKLRVISNSFFKYSNLPKNPSKNYFFLMNNVTGCVSMINNTLREFVFRDYIFLSQNIDKILMHDHFFAIIAENFGKRIFIDKKTNLYRQHSNNVVGTDSKYTLQNNFSKLFSLNKSKDKLQANKVFLSFFSDYYNDFLCENKTLIKKFINIKKYPKIFRIFFLLKHGILKKGLLRNVGLFITI